MARKTTTTTTKETTNTSSTWTCPEGEEGYIHAEIEIRKFDPTTGKRRSKPSVQVYEPAVEWEQFVVFGPRMGIFVNTILHTPEGVTAEYQNPGGEIVKG